MRVRCPTKFYVLLVTDLYFQDLVTRLSHESNKSEMDHKILMEHLNGTWTELPAGGGKFYMKPQCEVRDPMRFLSEKANNHISS